jgi:catechol 2,3-dioxygenase-like lactoylglutathione lyase family enzyme
MPDARLLSAEPQLFVADLQKSCDFFTGKLGFAVAFLYGRPPFYGQVRRGQIGLNLRHVDTPVFDSARRDREDLLSACTNVDDVEALFREFDTTGVSFHQRLRTEPWGAVTFIVKDPDGNLLLFAGQKAP